MSERRSSSDLGASAEAALSAFPIPERDWESDARAIEARLEHGLLGSTQPELLAPPLPSEGDEPSTLSATATPLTNSGVRTQSLAELARRSVEKKQANERQIARESLAIAAQQRQVPIDARALREAVQRPRSEPPAPPSPGPLVSAAAAVNAPVASARPWPKLALALPALALAAAALLWLRRPEPTPLASQPLAPAAANTIATATPSALDPSAHSANALADNRSPSAEEAPRGIDPNTLPVGEPPAAEAPAVKVGSVSAKPNPSKLLPKDARASEPKANEQALPPDPELRPADSRSGELPAKPTTGAVQAALGSVMGGARHCVAGDEAPSSAVVVFGSDGRVQHVTVSGAAAGKSSATCIEAQLSRARVQPFAAASFSVNATVRPE